MLYLVVGWKDDKIETWLWYLLFSQATSEYARQISAYRFTKVSFYRVDLESLTIELLGEE